MAHILYNLYWNICDESDFTHTTLQCLGYGLRTQTPSESVFYPQVGIFNERIATSKSRAYYTSTFTDALRSSRLMYL